MKLSFVSLCGFRGYRVPVHVSFAPDFTIIDGRNGVGKSTIFDAVEFAMTGRLTKYDEATASGESVADYLWWTGEGSAPPEERYVEVGFVDGDVVIRIRRTQLGEVDATSLELLADRVCDRRLAPPQPLPQLCRSSIIRDEQITQLSLDLKETDRYALLRDALGASDADLWIRRGGELVALAKKRVTAAQTDVGAANAEVATVTRRLDEVRARLVADSVLADAILKLQTFADTLAPAEQLSAPVRQRIASMEAEIGGLEDLAQKWEAVEGDRLRIADLSRQRDVATDELAVANKHLASLSPPETHISSSQELAEEATSFVKLVGLGRSLGLHDGRCPLCSKEQSQEDFDAGMELALAIAKRLSEGAAKSAEFEQSRLLAERRVTDATAALKAASDALSAASDSVRGLDAAKVAQGLDAGADLETIKVRIGERRALLDAAIRDLRVLDTLRLSTDLTQAQRLVEDSNNRHSKAQERFGRARKAEATAHALHDAARRAASETLDRRLERVLPLMSELYRRLKPHPVWVDIEYSIRGDIRRFMKLQVGDELNPQFLFSSGQRRATGLAFLLSVSLSLAWSRWRSILLDDPVQHVDDFRAVHLAEVMAQLVSEGRQIICAVEDAALADLLCRRLPVKNAGAAKRITLGPDRSGDLTVLEERPLTPLSAAALISTSQLKAG